jgi:hypothetical protein
MKVSSRRTTGFEGQSLSFDASGLEELTGWKVSDMHMEISKIFPRVASLLFASKLRVCHGCLAEGFHSVWHQFRLLSRCPLHNQELSENCLCCEAVLANLDDPAGRFSVYSLLQCQNCGQSPSFQRFSAKRFSTFCESPERIAAAFEPLQTWAKSGQKSFETLNEFIEQNEPRSWRIWCDVPDFLLGVLDRLYRLPDVVDRSRLVNVGMQRFNHSGADIRCGTRIFHNSYSLSARPVYVLMLRKFNRWVYGQDAPRQVREDLEALLGQQGLKPGRRDSREIALVLFRAWHELFFQEKTYWNDPGSVILSERLPVNSHGHNLKRGAQRALLLGSFAVLNELVKRQNSPTYHAAEFVDDKVSLAHLLPVLETSKQHGPEGAGSHEVQVFYIRPE